MMTGLCQDRSRNINNLKFAVDIDMIEEYRNKLHVQENMNEVRKAGDAVGLGLKINVGKQKQW